MTPIELYFNYWPETLFIKFLSRVTDNYPKIWLFTFLNYKKLLCERLIKIRYLFLKNEMDKNSSDIKILSDIKIKKKRVWKGKVARRTIFNGLSNMGCNNEPVW